MHYQRLRRTKDPLMVRPAGRPRNDRVVDFFERSKGQWSRRTIYRAMEVERHCDSLATDESGNVDSYRSKEELNHLRWVTGIRGLRDNVAGMERMALAKLYAKAAGCTEGQWADLERDAFYPKEVLKPVHRRVNVTRLERLAKAKMQLKRAGCTEDEWANLRRAAQDPPRTGHFGSVSLPRVNVDELKRLVWIKLEDMVNEGRTEKVRHGTGALYTKRTGS